MKIQRWLFALALSAVLSVWPLAGWGQQEKEPPAKPPDAAKDAPPAAPKKDAPAEAPPKGTEQAPAPDKPKTEPAAAPEKPKTETPAAPPTAPTAAQLEPLPAPPKKMVLNFRNASIREVVSQVARVNGLTVVFDTEPSGEITVISPREVNTDDAIQILNAALSLKAITAVRTGEVLKIVSLSAAPKSNVPVHTGNDPEAVETGDHVITQVIPILHADAVQLRQDLTPLIPDQASLVANAGTNTLIFTARATDVRRLLTILKSLDSQIAEVSDIRIFTLKNADATEMAQALRELFTESAQSRSTSSRTGSSFFDAMRERFMQFRFGGGPGGPPPAPPAP
ncbi:MAG: hypothetical protein FJ272_16530 [Planctomycetes bacterium]|nr:hypothetical protein [Planctomycetota bacterium]